jgi:hypothetical protein
MDQTDDTITPETGHLNGTLPAEGIDQPAATAADVPAAAAAPEATDPVGLRPGFLSELAIAMRATAERERENIGTRVSEDAAGHVEKVRARAAIETEELRRLAEEDVQHIEDWSASEMERIRAEADQKIGDRRASLDEYLKQHDAIIETEIEGVDNAVRDYNGTLDAFFAELSQSDDPSAIVARAETLPAPPDLDQVRAQARASAVAMFAQPDVEEAAPAAEAVEGPAPAAEADAPTAEADAPAAEAHAPAAEAVAEAVTETPSDSDGGPPAGSFTSDAVATEPERVDGEAGPEAVVSDTGAEVTGAAATADPVPVMDPAAAAEGSWPTPEPEPAGVAPSADHTSAAVRLLRSVAPWTAPTHAGSEPGPDPD